MVGLQDGGICRMVGLQDGGICRMVGLGLMGVWLVGLGRKLSESGFGGWKDLQDGGFGVGVGDLLDSNIVCEILNIIKSRKS